MASICKPSTALVLSIACLAAPADAQTPPTPSRSPATERLRATLDAMDIENRWLPGQAVHWRTGTVDRDGRQRATHCSSFAAAFCERMGVYLLRPPEHSLTLLATAQAEWLESPAARKRGWKPVATPVEAQRLANEGMVVVAAFANPNRKKPGHIAIVRPSDASRETIEKEGPRIMQAGSENLRDASLKRGFSKHPEAIKNHLIKFFAHEPGEKSAG